MFYILCGLSVLITLFLISITVQLIRVEKRLTEVGFYIENKLTNILNIPAPKKDKNEKKDASLKKASK